MATIDDHSIDPEGQIVAFPADDEYRLAWVAHGDARSLRDHGAPSDGPEHWEVTFMDADDPLPILVDPDTLSALRPVSIAQERVVLPEGARHWKAVSYDDLAQIVAVPNLGLSGSHRIGIVEQTPHDDQYGLYYSIAALNESWTVGIHTDQADKVLLLPTRLSRAEVQSLAIDAAEQRPYELHANQEGTEQQAPTRVRSIALGL